MKRRTDSSEWLEIEASDVLRSLTFAPGTEEVTTPGMLTVPDRKRGIREATPEILHPDLVNDLVRRPRALWDTDARAKLTPIGEAIRLEIDQAIEDVLGNAFEDPLGERETDRETEREAERKSEREEMEVAPSWAVPVEGVHDTKEIAVVSTSPGLLVTRGLKMRIRSRGWLRRAFATLIVLGSLAITTREARFASEYVEARARSIAEEVSARFDEVARTLARE